MAVRRTGFELSSTPSMTEAEDVRDDSHLTALFQKVTERAHEPLLKKICGGSGVAEELTHYEGPISEGYFNGFILNGKAEGWGILRYKNGDIFKGEFKNGLREGYGTLKYFDGAYYRGYYKAGRRDGKGILKTVEGDVRLGEFRGGVFHGEGKRLAKNGDVFEGRFEKGKFVRGQFKNRSGYSYTGEFEDPHGFHGQGVLTKPNGVYRGKFEFGKFISGDVEIY